MSLEGILEDIKTSGHVEVAQIEVEARDQIEQILAQARVEAEKLRQEACEAAILQAKHQGARLMLEARSLELKIIFEARQALIDEALESTRQKLVHLRKLSTYPAVLIHLTKQALEELYTCLESNEAACLHADSRDEEILKPFLNEHFPNLQVNYDLDCWGGVTAQCEDNLIAIMNTLEARFEKSKPHLHYYLVLWFEGDVNK